MRNRDAYKKEKHTALELVQIRFAEFKAQGHNFDTATQARLNRHVEKVEQHINATKAKLKKLDAAHDDMWEELVDGVENTWTVLQSTLEDAVASFKD
ncbi:hypothetical protein UWK_00984 [Desulfocapsa sulfexigens DSM 10523]|uniref:Coiled coil domain-containing protein n=1 Tax=Desulfocapsa sulfexigens (strain DSM 10523 / SB164P1) TaxID=1167006 RepID=M1P252_DESSD|nr:hypothetical protein [Desulfocapsa sulfexigens]AGF77558.1 hypothetical protein UWK_00984 [Desulfocapsa sulfexigens DSM 10523]